MLVDEIDWIVAVGAGLAGMCVCDEIFDRNIREEFVVDEISKRSQKR